MLTWGPETVEGSSASFTERLETAASNTVAAGSTYNLLCQTMRCPRRECATLHALFVDRSNSYQYALFQFSHCFQRHHRPKWPPENGHFCPISGITFPVKAENSLYMGSFRPIFAPELFINYQNGS